MVSLFSSIIDMQYCPFAYPFIHQGRYRYNMYHHLYVEKLAKWQFILVSKVIGTITTTKLNGVSVRRSLPDWIFWILLLTTHNYVQVLTCINCRFILGQYITAQVTEVMLATWKTTITMSHEKQPLQYSVVLIVDWQGQKLHLLYLVLFGDTCLCLYM